MPGQKAAVLADNLQFSVNQQLGFGFGRRIITGNNAFLFHICIKLLHNIQEMCDVALRCRETGNIAAAPAYAVNKILTRHIAEKVLGIAKVNTKNRNIIPNLDQLAVLGSLPCFITQEILGTALLQYRIPFFILCIKFFYQIENISHFFSIL